MLTVGCTGSYAALDSGYDYYENGATLYQAGEYAAAAIQLKNALKEDSTDLPSRILLGWANLRMGNAAGAAKELELARRFGADEDLILVPLGNAYLLQRKHQQILDEVRSSDPSRIGGSEVLVIRGQAHLQLKQLEEAERMFQQARDQNPDYVEAVLGLARVELAQFDFDAAEAYSKEALEMAPRSAEPWFLSSELLRIQKDYQGSLAGYNRALEINPGHMRARNSRASVLLELGNNSAAIEDLDFILDKVPQDAQAAYLKAMAATRDGDRETAREAIETASDNLLQLSPQRMRREPASLLLAGIVAQSQGNLDQARRYLKTYTKMRPKHVGSRKLLGRVQLELGLGSEAIETLYPAVSLAPNDAELLALTGSAFLMQHNFIEAAGMFEKAIALMPENANIQTQLAVGHIGKGDSDAALASLEKVLEDNPGQSRAGVLLVLMYARAGDAEAALRTANLLLEKGPRVPTYLNLRGSLYMSAGDLAAARRDFETASSYSPGYVPAQLNLAKISVMEGRWDDATKRYEAILEQNPRETIAMRSLARIAVAQGDLHKAIGWVEEARAVNPDIAGASLDLAALYLNAGEYQTARDLALTLVANNPENSDAVEMLARVEIAMGNSEQAAEVLRRASRFPSFSAEKLISVAQLQLSVEDYEGAERTLEKALKAYPDSAQAITALVRLDILLGRYDRALARASKITRLRPDDPVGWALRGDVMVKSGRPVLAIGAYEKAISLAPGSVLIVRQFGAWRDANYIHAGIWSLESWMKAQPDDLLVFRSLAGAYLQAGYLDNALVAHEKLLESFPDDASILNNFAWIYNEQEDERAQQFARRAYALNKEDPIVLDTLGWILVEAGEPREGISYLRQAQSRAANDPQIRYHLAVALAELGRNREARNALEVLLGSDAFFAEREEAGELLEYLILIND